MRSHAHVPRDAILLLQVWLSYFCKYWRSTISSLTSHRIFLAIPHKMKAGKTETGRYFKIFCHLLDKEFFFFLFFQTINKAVTKLQASASNKACARFCTLYWYKQPFAYALQNRCSQKIRKIHRKTLVKKSLFQ